MESIVPVVPVVPTRPVRGRPQTQSSSRAAVERVVLCLRERLDEELPLERMAEIAGVSPFHFLRMFQRFTGVTPALFLSALRLEEAKRLLLTTARSVTDICFEVGYNSLGTFTTRFTQLVGLSPARLRRLGSGFRLEALAALAERLAAAVPNAGPYTVFGTLDAGGPVEGVIFLGLFTHSLPQERPLACTLLSAPGPFRLNAPGPGRRHLFAACFSLSPQPQDFLLASRSVRRVAASGPLKLRAGGGPAGPLNLRLRPLGLLDPPLLVALPLLLAERSARAVVHEPDEVSRLVAAHP